MNAPGQYHQEIKQSLSISSSSRKEEKRKIKILRQLLEIEWSHNTK